MGFICKGEILRTPTEEKPVAVYSAVVRAAEEQWEGDLPLTAKFALLYYLRRRPVCRTIGSKPIDLAGPRGFGASIAAGAVEYAKALDITPTVGHFCYFFCELLRHSLKDFEIEELESPERAGPRSSWL